MFSINRVTLIGFLGRDAEVRRTRSTDSPFTVLSVATNRRWKDAQSGLYRSTVAWHRCVVFGKAADFAATLTKGTPVEIDGALHTRLYTPSSDGPEPAAKRAITEVRVYRLSKLNRPAKAPEQGAAETAPPQKGTGR